VPADVGSGATRNGDRLSVDGLPIVDLDLALRGFLAAACQVEEHDAGAGHQHHQQKDEADSNEQAYRHFVYSPRS